MKILYYSWDEMICVDVMEAFKELDCEFKRVRYEHKSDFYEPDFQKFIEKELEEDNYDLLFSINYIPVLSMAAFNKKIFYMSWVYDCPCGTMYSETIKNPLNIVFDFDETEVRKFNNMGIENVFHMPLAASINRMDRQMKEASSKDHDLYKKDISLIASISEYKSQFEALEGYNRGYVEAIIKTQTKVFGDEIVEKFVCSDMGEKIAKCLNFTKNPDMIIRDSDLLEMLCNKEIRDIDRLELARLLNDKVSKKYDTALYTDYKGDAFSKVNKGIVDTYKGQYLVYKNSKINLNPTLRGIKSGINQRSVDVAACGGFLLTNYSHELARDLEAIGACVIYYDLMDLEAKIDYYMSHEDERLEIAARAHDFYKKNRTYTIVLGKMLESFRKI